jgi:hypothetical protein
MLVLLLVGVPMLGMADLACAKTGIEVTVWDGTKRVEGAKVKVERVDPDGEVHSVTEATTGADGRATVEVDADTTYRITTTAGDREDITTFETKGPYRDHTTMIWTNTQDTGLGHYMKVSTRLLLERARKAVAACDRKAYDDAVARIRAAIADAERTLQERRTMAEDFAREKGIPYSTLPQAKKALKTARAMPASARDEQQMSDLDLYVFLLEQVAEAEQDLQQYRKDLQSVPPFPDSCPKDKYGMAPSGDCPEGKFAGGLGGLLGLPVACEDPSRRRETDREREKDRKD